MPSTSEPIQCLPTTEAARLLVLSFAMGGVGVGVEQLVQLRGLGQLNLDEPACVELSFSLARAGGTGR